MRRTESYQGFVPVTILLPGRRIVGMAWKFGNRRLLQQIEEDKRQFLPIVTARIFDLTSPAKEQPEELPVVAVSTNQMIAIIPGDVATPVGKKSVRRRGASGKVAGEPQ